MISLINELKNDFVDSNLNQSNQICILICRSMWPIEWQTLEFFFFKKISPHRENLYVFYIGPVLQVNANAIRLFFATEHATCR